MTHRAPSPRGMVREGGKATLARAAMSGLEPLVELLLELGVTSPEAESLLRSLFVHTAHKWLAKSKSGGEGPSDVRVSLVSGVHRNFVRTILAEPPRIAASREQKRHPASRLLEAWHSDAVYLDGSSKPRDLWLKRPEPSFFSLASTYLPGASAGVVLEELRRAGLVQLLAEGRVRVRSRTFQVRGVNASTMSELGKQTRQLLQTLIHNMREPDASLFCDSMRSIEVEADRLPAVRDLISRRAGNFLAAIRQELAIETIPARRTKSKNRVRVGLTAFETQRWPAGSAREER